MCNGCHGASLHVALSQPSVVDEHVEYTLTVSSSERIPGSLAPRVLTWSFPVRYSSFAALETQLRSEHLGELLRGLTLPPSQWFGRLSSALVQERLVGCERWLRGVCALPGVADFERHAASPALRAFLFWPERFARAGLVVPTAPAAPPAVAAPATAGAPSTPQLSVAEMRAAIARPRVAAPLPVAPPPAPQEVPPPAPGEGDAAMLSSLELPDVDLSV